MNILSLLTAAVAVSIDGFMSGFAAGAQKIRIPLMKAAIITALVFVMCFAAALCGRFSSAFISQHTANVISGVLLIILGIWALKNALIWDGGSTDISSSKTFAIALAVSADASCTAFALAVSGVSPLVIAAAFCAAHFVLILLGNYAAKYLKYVKGAAFASPAIFFTLAIMRLI